MFIYLYIYIYIFKTHIHPYIQIVNVIFTYSRSHCCECADADGRFESSSLTDKPFQTPVELLWNTLRLPKAEEVLLCVILTFSERAGSGSAAASSSLKPPDPHLTERCPRCFLLHIAFNIAAVSRVEGETRGSSAAVIERR